MPKSRSSQNDQTAIRARLTEIAQQVLGSGNARVSS